MLGRGRRGATQARGRARRHLLLDAARILLRSASLNEITLADVSAAAGIPKSSAYHFYADMHALYAELAGVQDAELHALLAAPLDPARRWQDIVAAVVQRAATYFRDNRSAQQLMFGPTTPPDIKRSSRAADMTHGEVLADHIAGHFALPDIPDRERVFFRTVEAIDLMFGLSLLEHEELRDDMVEEAIKIANAYLALYLGPDLPPRQPR